ncbi:MAG TPA: amidohydrolase [Peptococcaceae bacterium]|jgi:5-methylthioadenosine/S-adenosylhomocysteine deaminase|nr:amidohydrolase [Clostridia bacterium]HOB81232.1 amidohydrolase [Peptococcaceae bacterium]HQD53318.1 amidohydrolase [Peptococcaceae bacterium]
MSRILIQKALIAPLVTLPELTSSEQLWFTGDILIEGQYIKAVGKDLSGYCSAGGGSGSGKEAGTLAEKGNLTVLNGQDYLVFPGFVNCHTHAAMTMLRGYADDLPLMIWLEQKIWPREAFLEKGDIYWGSQLAVLEMLKSGTTTFADMYFYMEETAQVALEAGIRACLSRGMVGAGPNRETAVQESESLVQTWHGQGEGRISCMFGPHAPYTCPPEYLKRVMALADTYGVGLHIHLAETRQEVEDIRRQYGLRPIELMESIGLFDGRHVLAAHCVHLAENEMAILARHQVGIAHNPESNMKLASGIAPVPQLLAHGAVVGLGTDGAASNNNLDMLEEMRSCALLHKVAQMDPTVMPAPLVLELATKRGAAALGLKDTGSLAPGQKADLVMLKLREPHLTPLHDPIANLIYAARSTDVQTVIVDGRIVMKDRHMLTMDEERILYEAAVRGRALVER